MDRAKLWSWDTTAYPTADEYLIGEVDDVHVLTAFFTWPEVGVPPCFGFRLADGRFVYMYLIAGT